MTYLLEIEELPIRINSRGEWLHGNTPLHPKVRDLFNRNIQINDDLTYRIELGANRSDIDVEDVAFFVSSIQLLEDSNGALEEVKLLISDGIWEMLDPDTVMQSAENVFYCGVKRCGYSVPCRFQPAAYHEIALYADIVEGRPVLIIGGEHFSIDQFDSKPKPL